MKLKGKTFEQLEKAQKRLEKTNPVLSGYIKNYLRKHSMRLTGIPF